MDIITLIISLLMALGLVVMGPVTGPRPPDTETPIVEATVASVSEVPVDESASGLDRQDVALMRRYTRGIFLSGDWTAVATPGVARTTLTYRSLHSSSLMYMEDLHFPLADTAVTVPGYIKDNYFDVILSTFASWKKVDECHSGDLYLYEFTAKYETADYDVRYWALQTEPQRILTVSMNFQRGSEAIDRYAQAMFPQLPSCSTK